MKNFFIKKHFKDLKTHDVEVSGQYGKYDIYLVPKQGN